MKGEIRVLCAYCNKNIETLNYKTWKKQHYHPECFELLVDNTEKSNAQKAKNHKKKGG